MSDKKFLDIIKSRRSIRKYKENNIPDDIIKELIDAARHAPSSKDSQPWGFIVIRNHETKRELAKLKNEENEETLLKAPVIIAVCVNTEKSSSRWVEDGACVAMNILLAAHSLGLGAVYITGYSKTTPGLTPKLQNVLGLPKHIIPVCLIPVGYSNEIPKTKKFREINELIHYEKW